MSRRGGGTARRWGVCGWCRARGGCRRPRLRDLRWRCGPAFRRRLHPCPFLVALRDDPQWSASPLALCRSPGALAYLLTDSVSVYIPQTPQPAQAQAAHKSMCTPSSEIALAYPHVPFLSYLRFHLFLSLLSLLSVRILVLPYYNSSIRLQNYTACPSSSSCTSTLQSLYPLHGCSASPARSRCALNYIPSTTRICRRIGFRIARYLHMPTTYLYLTQYDTFAPG
ncbi:hypothetical protein B0H15DRAFT_862829 [Mycena belliarum]|uniref:Uncharacterized protein n=1 Tax=Mycena belliarum TaxID=1033014 RepID=A0AAD6TSV8_9AGAR|nr:hypothetical protein B0H15DRAFT_862829 [Mycena belliae]